MPDVKEFLTDIQSDDAEVRFAAWRSAGEVSADAIPELGKLAASENPGVAKAAQEALSTMVHAVGKDTADNDRPAVVKGLLGLTGSESAQPVRAHAFRLLSNIAGDDSVPAIASQIGDAAVREEVVYSLERIPGDASIEALQSAYPSAADEFKPRILAALGHRQAASAVDLCLQAATSDNIEIAMAGVKAFGRIGEEGSSALRQPDPGNLSEWQKIDLMDSMLRYADRRAAANDTAEAMRVYEMALNHSEEHWQCAAIIGIAKIGTPAAAEKIFPKLDSTNNTVRITAEKAWRGMAG